MTHTHEAVTPLEELKAAQLRTWNSGDYGRIAWLTVPLARCLVTETGVRPGSSVLDVATGTGHVAIEAARMFCNVTGIDYVDSLVEVARRRAVAEVLPIAFEVADAEELPFADASFDAVLSAIGVMFTADHDRAAAELVRVCRPGGRIGVASWTAEGFIGQLLKTVTAHVQPPPVALPPTRWGNEEVVRELLGAPRRRGHRRDLVGARRDAAFRLRGGVRRLHAHLLRADLHGRPAPRRARSRRAPR
jgi:SAM-dependent methyltransferase